MITQTPWFERRFDFTFPVGCFPVIVERLRGTGVRLETLLTSMPETRLEHKPEGEWSAKEHVGHLFDLEELWYNRVEDFFAGKKILSAADLTNAKTHAANHNQRSTDQLMRQFVDARNRLITRVKNLDEAAAALTSLHPRLQKPMRLVDSLFFVAEHDDHHLAKIRSCLAN